MKVSDDQLDRACAAHWQATVDSLDLTPVDRARCGYDALSEEQREISRAAMKAALAVLAEN